MSCWADSRFVGRVKQLQEVPLPASPGRPRKLWVLKWDGRKYGQTFLHFFCQFLRMILESSNQVDQTVREGPAVWFFSFPSFALTLEPWCFGNLRGPDQVFRAAGGLDRGSLAGGSLHR